MQRAQRSSVSILLDLLVAGIHSSRILAGKRQSKELFHHIFGVLKVHVVSETIRRRRDAIGEFEPHHVNVLRERDRYVQIVHPSDLMKPGRRAARRARGRLRGCPPTDVAGVLTLAFPLCSRISPGCLLIS